MTVNRELTDSIMVIIHCPDVDSFVLSHLPSGWHVPYNFCANGSWRKWAMSFYQSLTGSNPPDTFEMKKVYRFWRGDDLSPLQNVIFYAKVSQETLEGLIHDHPLIPKAVSVNTIQDMINKRTLNPEIQNFLDISISDDHNSNRAPVFSSENLIEVMKNDIITLNEDSGELNMLINSSELSSEEQIVLYDLYLDITYPYTMMDESNMSDFINKLGIITFKSDHFRTADTSNRGCINFKELLGFISVVHPQIYRDQVSEDQRCRYIFRYYDRDRDDRLSMEEFGQMIDDIAVNNQNTNDKKALLGSSSDGFITLLDYLNLVGSQKLRGTSTLLVPKVSMHDALNELSAKTRRLRDGTKPSKLQSKFGSFSLAGHVASLFPSGTIESLDIRDIRTAVRADPTNQIPHDSLMPSASSTDTFNMQTSPTLVLAALKYFSEEIMNVPERRNNWWSVKFNDFPQQVMRCCKEVQNIFQSEPRLLKIGTPVYILGDIHGSYYDIVVFQKWFWSFGLEYLPGSVLFLGDYVDRGMSSVEVVAYLIAQKIKNPKKIFLLRGNHETRRVQKEWGFLSECLSKFEKGGREVWDAVNDVFDRLPLAALIDNQVFCCHGGIPMPSICNSLEVINKIGCPLSEPSVSKLAWALLWNDPQKVGYNYFPGKKVFEGGFSKNTRRKTGHTFDSVALKFFIEKHNLSYVVRAHEVQDAGFQVDLDDKLITVFSSSYYNRGHNKAGCILAQKNKLRIFMIAPPTPSAINNAS